MEKIIYYVLSTNSYNSKVITCYKKKKDLLCELKTLIQNKVKSKKVTLLHKKNGVLICNVDNKFYDNYILEKQILVFNKFDKSELHLYKP